MITNTSPLHNGTAGSPYNLPLNATGGFPPYTWSVIIGTLPTGFVVSGSATEAGLAPGFTGLY